jgi:alpha-ketoglutarate-dependent taurine dioxygenase
MRPVKASSIAAKGLSTAIENAIPFDVAWDVGDILIIDNYRLLHGRGRSTVPDDDRKLIRVLVQGDAVA